MQARLTQPLVTRAMRMQSTVQLWQPHPSVSALMMCCSCQQVRSSHWALPTSCSVGSSPLLSSSVTSSNGAFKPCKVQQNAQPKPKESYMHVPYA